MGIFIVENEQSETNLILVDEFFEKYTHHGLFVENPTLDEACSFLEKILFQH